MIHLLMSHPGTHAVAHAAPVAVLPLLFRRAIAAVRRKPAAPEVQTTASGAGAGGSDWDDAMPRPHIPADRVATESLAWAGLDAGRPVLGDKMLSEVRAEHDALRPRKVLPRHDGEVVIDERNHVTVRPVNGRYLGTLPRRLPGATLPYVEPLVDRGPRKPPWHTTQMPVCGQAPVARVLEAERLAQVMQP